MLNAASIATLLGKYEEAQSHLEAILSQGKHNDKYTIHAWNALAKLFHLQSINSQDDHVEEQFRQKAMNSLAESVKCQKSHPVTWIQLGLMAMDAKQYLTAINYFKNVLMKHPGCIPAWCNLGLATLLMGDTKNAESIYLKGLDICPDSYQICNNLGNLYRQLGMCYRPRGFIM